ncbi:hypothetical protein VTJ83DRAFT_659 [Remersonia thermophila]|uniref:Tyrosinase copper-binding domain-containing protein n=1 Tax=Remersonia thermophila TaxID=72144 RepID=A0ABR4DLK4_9PEZI
MLGLHLPLAFFSLCYTPVLALAQYGGYGQYRFDVYRRIQRQLDRHAGMIMVDATADSDIAVRQETRHIEKDSELWTLYILALTNTIHATVGGGGPGQTNTQPGHMGWIQWSAFDPILFLHHCMVDRTYTTQKGATINSTTTLAPFFGASGIFWDSDGVRGHTKLRYTYAERIGGVLHNNGTDSRLAQVSRVRQAVNRMRGSFSPASVFLRELRAHGIKEEPTIKQHFRSKKLPRSLLANKIFVTSSEGNRCRERAVHVRADKQALASTWSGKGRLELVIC